MSWMRFEWIGLIDKAIKIDITHFVAYHILRRKLNKLSISHWIDRNKNSRISIDGNDSFLMNNSLIDWLTLSIST